MREDLLYLMESHYRAINNLESQYGTSIRPGWVGEEIGLSCMYIQKYAHEAGLVIQGDISKYFDENGKVIYDEDRD